MKFLDSVLLFLCTTFGFISIFTASFPPNECTTNTTMAETREVNSALGIVLAAVASLVNSVGLFVQKVAHDQTERHLSNPTWWLGFVGITCAELMNAGAYGYAPAPVVSSIGSLTILANALLATVFLKERLRLLPFLGMLTIVIGIVLLILTSPSTTKVYTPAELEALYISTTTLFYGGISLLLTLLLAVWETKRFNLPRLTLYAALVSSWTVVAVRGTLAFLFVFPDDCSECGCTQTLRNWLFWFLLDVILVSAWWGGGVVEQRGIKQYSQTKWVPLHFCACFFSFTISSVTVFGEWNLFHKASIPMLFMGVFLCTWGIVLVTEMNPCHSAVET